MIICHLRYRVDLNKLDAFREYARNWVMLVERMGGRHFGYLLAAEDPHPSSFSFPGLGRAGAPDTAFALFSFSSIEAYENYRANVRLEPECAFAERLLEESACVLDYERTFTQRVA